jgi:hypothetical protein
MAPNARQLDHADNLVQMALGTAQALDDLEM